jgi:mRNA interferase RelE/StbE
MYRVDAARSSVKKQLRRIARADLARIGEVVGALAAEPYPVGAVQLQKDIYRIRVGDYRIIYKVYEEEKLILIGRVVRRSESTYRKTGELFD